MDILKIWEGELRRMLLYDKGSYDVANSRYNDLMEQCDITEQVHVHVHGGTLLSYLLIGILVCRHSITGRGEV